MRIQLRLVQIRNEIEILESPILRETYENVHFPTKNIAKDSSKNPRVFVVTKEDTIAKQIEYLESAKSVVAADGTVNLLPSLKVRPIQKQMQTKFNIELFFRIA